MSQNEVKAEWKTLYHAGKDNAQTTRRKLMKKIKKLDEEAKQYLYEKAVALFKENRHVEEAAAAVHRTVLQSIDECTRELREVQLGLNELREAASRALAQTTKPKKSRDLLLTVLRKRTEHRELYRRSVEREPDPLIRKAGQKPAKKKKKVDILDIFQPDTLIWIPIWTTKNWA
ncbi:uncharacterized protein LOC129584923, partial [Paramacrobiotus metropolitanus]|uniref:uncharacterized protein LOC129584923 n=1 Tax=Paramacrobiotus metropolitanus TaxID=2943436 RepID=UPI0024463093